MSAWINIDSLSTFYFFDKRVSNIGFGLLNGGGKLEAFTQGASGLRDIRTTNVVLTLNTWHHVVVTKSTLDAVSAFTIYVDGIKVPLTTLTDTAPGTVLNDGKLIIGARHTTVQILDGQMDDFKIFNYELTASEVAKLSEFN